MVVSHFDLLSLRFQVMSTFWHEHLQRRSTDYRHFDLTWRTRRFGIKNYFISSLIVQTPNYDLLLLGWKGKGGGSSSSKGSLINFAVNWQKVCLKNQSLLERWRGFHVCFWNKEMSRECIYVQFLFIKRLNPRVGSAHKNARFICSWCRSRVEVIKQTAQKEFIWTPTVTG